MHAPELVKLVLVRVLDDAQTIRPEVLESERVCGVDRVADSLREESGVDPSRVGSDVGFTGLVRLFFSPYIAESEIFSEPSVSRDQARAVGVGAVNSARRKAHVLEW